VIRYSAEYVNRMTETAINPSSTADAEAGCPQRFPIAENLCPVLRNDWVNPEYKLLALAAGPVALAVRPGQFFHLACPSIGADEPLLRRPMSVYRIEPELREIQFLYKIQGSGTRGLASLAAGDKLDAFGPLGHGFDVPPGTRHVLLVARGVGLATLAPLARQAVAAGAATTAILSARRDELMMSQDYLRRSGAEVHAVTDDGGNSDVASVEALIRGIHAERPVDLLATCGSNRLLLLLQRLGKEHGIAGQVALEQHMGCALGMCYACVRPVRIAVDGDAVTYRRVCWDGPVFDLQEVVSW